MTGLRPCERGALGGGGWLGAVASPARLRRSPRPLRYAMAWGRRCWLRRHSALPHDKRGGGGSGPVLLRAKLNINDLEGWCGGGAAVVQCLSYLKSERPVVDVDIQVYVLNGRVTREPTIAYLNCRCKELLVKSRLINEVVKCPLKWSI